MIKEISKDELVEMVFNLKENEVLDFAMDADWGNQLSSWSAIQKINWLDNEMLLIGGYQNETTSSDITRMLYEKEEIHEKIEKLIDDYLDYHGLDVVYLEIEE